MQPAHQCVVNGLHGQVEVESSTQQLSAMLKVALVTWAACSILQSLCCTPVEAQRR